MALTVAATNRLRADTLLQALDLAAHGPFRTSELDARLAILGFRADPCEVFETNDGQQCATDLIGTEAIGHLSMAWMHPDAARPDVPRSEIRTIGTLTMHAQVYDLAAASEYGRTFLDGALPE